MHFCYFVIPQNYVSFYSQRVIPQRTSNIRVLNILFFFFFLNHMRWSSEVCRCTHYMYTLKIECINWLSVQCTWWQSFALRTWHMYCSAYQNPTIFMRLMGDFLQYAHYFCHNVCYVLNLFMYRKHLHQQGIDRHLVFHLKFMLMVFTDKA